MWQTADDLADGNIGRVHADAVPVSFAEVHQILTQKIQDSKRRSQKIDESTAALFQKALNHALLIQDSTANEDDLQKVRELVVHRKYLQSASTALSGFMPRGGEGPLDLSTTMKPWEAMQLAMLLPQSLDEALHLIPSLRNYEEMDVISALEILNSSF
jgi:hypothetical protein